MERELKVISDELAIMFYQEFLECEDNEKDEFLTDLFSLQMNCIGHMYGENKQ